MLDDEVPAAQQQRRLSWNLHATLVLRRDHSVVRRHRDHHRVGLHDDAVRVHDERVEADARAAHSLGRELLEGAPLGLGGCLSHGGRGREHHRVHRALQRDGGLLRRRGRDRTGSIGGGVHHFGGGLEVRATPEPSHGHHVPGGRGEGFGGWYRAPRRRRRDPREQNARSSRGRRQWWTRCDATMTTTAALKRVLLPAAFAENASGKQLASHVANFG